MAASEDRHQPNGAPPTPPGSGGTGSQMESLVAKLLQLADAGVGLGINMISLINTYAQRQMAADPQPPAQAPPQTSSPKEPEADRGYCIVNRVPLHPGSAVSVPFSINNEQTDAIRHLRLSVLGFTGTTYGSALPQADFSVDPKEREIGPMDFDRFVLLGTIPGDVPPDLYSGWVLVQGDEEVRIPVMLMVSPPS